MSHSLISPTLESPCAPSGIPTPDEYPSGLHWSPHIATHALGMQSDTIVGTHALGMQSDPLVGACSEVAPRVPPSDASKAIWPRPPSRRYAGDHSGRKYDLGATRRVCLPARLTVSVWSVSVSVSVSVCAIPPRIWPLHHAVHRYIPLPARAQQHTPFPATTSTLTAFNCVIVRACVLVCWLAMIVYWCVMYGSSDYCGLP